MSFFCQLPDHLTELIATGKKYLVATGKQLWIADDTAVFTPQADGKGANFHTIELPYFWALFDQIRGDRTEFTRDELAQITRLGPALIERLEREAGIDQILGTYDPQSVFAAVIAATLYRKQVPFKLCLRAARFIRCGEGVACKN